MEVRVLYMVTYIIPGGTTYRELQKYCNDWNITMEKSKKSNRTINFYCSNQHQLEVLQFKFLLIHP